MKWISFLILLVFICTSGLSYARQRYCCRGYCHKQYYPYERVYIHKYTQPCTYRACNYPLDMATGDDDPSCNGDLNIDR